MTLLAAWAAVLPVLLARGVGLLLVVPMDVPGASPQPQEYPTQGSGFAAYIVGGFFGLAILVLFAVWTSRRPKRPS